MTEINQLARAKLAHEHGLQVLQICSIDGIWRIVDSPDWTKGSKAYRVNYCDEVKLDAIIWEGVERQYKYAYVRTKEVFLNHWMEPISNASLLKRWKLIATRELPAEDWDESRINVIAQNGNEGLHYDDKVGEFENKMQSVFYEAFTKCEENGISVEDILDGLVGSEGEKARLAADLEEFVEYVAENLLVDGHNQEFIKDTAKDLAQRINPKPVRNSADLPVDTLCEVWDESGHREFCFCDGNGAFLDNGSVSVIGNGSTNWDFFKVLEQPHPTFWQGGECPVPDWVEVDILFRDGTRVSINEASAYDWTHSKGRRVEDIIAYQIMGEKNDENTRNTMRLRGLRFMAVRRRFKQFNF